MCDTNDAAASGPTSGFITFYQPSVSAYLSGEFNLVGFDSNAPTTIYYAQGNFILKTSAVTTGIQIFPITGNFTTGTFKLYGVV